MAITNRQPDWISGSCFGYPFASFETAAILKFYVDLQDEWKGALAFKTISARWRAQFLVMISKRRLNQSNWPLQTSSIHKQKRLKIDWTQCFAPERGARKKMYHRYETNIRLQSGRNPRRTRTVNRRRPSGKRLQSNYPISYLGQPSQKKIAALMKSGRHIGESQQWTIIY